MLGLLLACVHPAAPPAPPVSAQPSAPSEVAAPAAPPLDELPPLPGELPPHRRFRTAAGALRAVLVSNPRILGVGELHATTDGPTVRAPLALFTDELFGVVAPHTTDLVLETWRVSGRCGEVEEAVAVETEAVTERPPEVKSDLVRLVEASVAANVRPHDLAFDCDEYASLLDPAGELRLDALLTLLTAKLGDFAVRAAGTPSATMILYGGAVHNDLHPKPELAAYSYAPMLPADSPYVELDLYPPELVRGVLAEPALEPLIAGATADAVILWERAPRSFVILLPRSAP